MVPVSYGTLLNIHYYYYYYYYKSASKPHAKVGLKY